MDSQKYTRKQREFIQKVLREIPVVKKYKDRYMTAGQNRLFYAELQPLTNLVSSAFLEENYAVIQKVFGLIEEFLNGSDEDLKEAVAFFFFEDLTNRLGWQDKKYMQRLVEMLGPNCKECCRIVDKFWKTKTAGLW